MGCESKIDVHDHFIALPGLMSAEAHRRLVEFGRNTVNEEVLLRWIAHGHFDGSGALACPGCRLHRGNGLRADSQSDKVAGDGGVQDRMT
jgi:hypothetical protein